MDPRYSGRLSPPRRYAAPGRNSTGRLDQDYESYYQPRVTRDSPRASAERVGSRVETRLPPASRSSRDDYYVAPRYSEGGGRAPLTIITPGGSSNRYRSAVSSATETTSSPYRQQRGRDYETYYAEPASSTHSRHYSIGSSDPPRYASDIDRDRGRDRPVYKSGGYRQSEYLSPVVASRDPRDRKDRQYEYEYSNSRDPYDSGARPRMRRVSDLGTRDRPNSIGGTEDLRRDKGPPVTTRGLARIEDDGFVRREYRYPRDDPPPPSRVSGSSRADREDRDKPKYSRGGLVAIHQDDGYSSNVESRSQDKSHRHKHRDATDRDKYADDDRRVEEPIKKHQRHESEDHRARHHRTDSEDRRTRSHKYREDSQDRGYERGNDRRERRAHDGDRKKDKHEDRRLAEGVAVGAAGLGAAGVLAEGLRHRQERDSPELDSESKKDHSRRHEYKEEADTERSRYEEEAEEERPRRRRHKDEGDSAREKGDGEGDGDRRERRRRRRKEREEREGREKDDAEGSSSLRDEDARSLNSKALVIPVSDEQDSHHSRRDSRTEEGQARALRRHGRRRHDRANSSDNESSDDSPPVNGEQERSRVRVVSPARETDRRPKSILRPPTQSFPEDPAPIREGVAPMKDAMKKGVPTNARWTKIDRRIVNPAALELANERFEERPDSVIVLRVLEKEEIEKFAAITQELRSRRAASRHAEEQPRMIESGYNGKENSDSDRPKQIAAHAYNEPYDMPIEPHQERSSLTGQDEHDRPPIQKEPSYQRFAPPGVQPQSTIPTYPAIPGRSSTSSVPFQQPQTPSTAPLSPDHVYPSQGGGYKSNQ